MLWGMLKILCERFWPEATLSVSFYTMLLHVQFMFSELGHHLGDFPVMNQRAAKEVGLPSVGLPVGAND